MGKDKHRRAPVAKALHFVLGAALAGVLICSGRARAAITDSAPGGFTIRETVHVAAPAEKVYDASIVPAHWWSSEHIFSGNAANLTLDAHAGGCWCETLPDGGSALHMIVVDVAPDKTLRLRGALGPFQAMAAEGAMTWALVPASGGTDLTLTYAIGGYTKDGFGDIAKAADTVFGLQIARLENFVETGQPSPTQGVTP